MIKRVLLTGCLLVGANAAMAFTPTTNVHNFGEVFIPRDARIGSQIAEQRAGHLQTIGIGYWRSTLQSTLLIGPRLPRTAAAHDVQDNDLLYNKGDHLYDSGVPGVGIATVYIGRNICNDTETAILQPNESFAPLNAKICNITPNFINHYKVFLVKTAEIPAGTHTINKDLYRVLLNGGPIIDGSISARVTVAGCELPASHKQITVDLGDHKLTSLETEGVTPAVEFSIPLHNCTAGRYPANMEWNYFTGNYANITLTPANGSTIVDAAAGMLGLKPDSTAEGVAVQILQSDGQPMRLGQEVRLNHVQDGTTDVPLKARYKKRPPVALAAGTANASANFTVTYK